MEYFEGLRNVKLNEDHEIYKVTSDNFRGNKTHVIAEGDYNGRHFAITRHTGGFPDVYIEIKPDDYIMTAECDEDDERYDLYDGNVHGGATFFGRCYWNDDDERFYLGWDYAHCGDRTAFDLIYGNDAKEWTIPELFMSVAQVEAYICCQNDEHWEETHALPEERDGT